MKKSAIKLKWTTENKIVAGFSWAVGLMLVVGLTSFTSTQRLTRDINFVAHTYNVIAHLEETLSLIEGAENHQRNFIISGNSSFLQPFYQTLPAIDKDLLDLQTLISDNSKQQQAITELKPLVHKRLDLLEDGIAIRQREGFEVFRHRMITPGKGIQAMANIRQVIQQMEQEEAFLLNQRQQAAAKSIKVTDAFVLGSIVLTFFLLVVAALLINRDLRARKLAEDHLRMTNAELEQARDAALESMRMKSEFLANMSHEIRTPLNAVIGLTGLLMDSSLDPQQADYVETVRSSGDALLSVINDILDFSKIEAGKLDLETVRFDPMRVVEEAVELIAPRAHEKKLELAFSFPQPLPPVVLGDPSRLRQILLNLIGNAVKFTRKGEVIIEVRPETEIGSQTTLRFAIRDTGIGISPEAQSRLFQPFTQADGSTTRQFGGTGLGLAISHQLVERMGGQIGLDSQPGEGSTFWFTLPFESAQESGAMGADAPHILDGLRALVVDDNATNRQIVCQQLAMWRIQGYSVEGGVEALQALKEAAAQGTPYRLAILDRQMPEMDGLMLARVIQDDPSIADIRLVMMTSLGNGDPEVLRSAGIGAHLTKPVKPSHLYDSLLMVMSKGRERTNSPRKQMVEASDLLEKTPFNVDLEDRKHVHVLVAEDNSVNQKVALRQLEKLGYKAAAVANGREVLEALEQVPYDLVLMDCQMPEMDGFEATRAVRARDRSFQHIPIIALTANAFKGERERCLAAGMNDYLSKPVQLEALDQILQRWTPRVKKVGATSQETGVIGPTDESLKAYLDSLEEEEGPEFLEELVDIYLEDTPIQLDKIRAALLERDKAAVKRAAHSLKGSSANMHAQRMVDLALAIEELPDPLEDGPAINLFSRLEAEFEEVQRICEAATGKHPVLAP